MLETLSYYSIKPLERGDLVKINFRNKDTFAIVCDSADLKEEKFDLKNRKYKLKPIKSVIKEKFFSESWFRIMEELAKNYFIPETAFLPSFIPKALLSSNIEIKGSAQGAERHQKYAIKGSHDERNQVLRGIIREHFARKKSVIIVAPRIENINKLSEELSRGVEDYVFGFSSKLTPKKYLELYNKALSEEHAVLIIGTFQSLFFDRPDVETIIVEEEGSRLWREREGFPFDLRKVAEVIAEIKQLKIIWSDEILRAETIYKAERGLIEASNLLVGRIPSAIETKLIEVTKPKNTDEKIPFTWISKELENEISDSIKNNDKILLYVNRKGYSSFTLCQDCGRPQLCPNCSTPLALHKKSDRKFLCHHCLKSGEVGNECQYCNSWKMKDYGLGIEKVQEEFSRLFPNAENVTIATEKIFSEPHQHFDLVAVISLDYLFSIPDFRINETIFRLVGELKSRAKKKFILQTRLEDHKVLSDALAGNISSFYQEEIKSRDELGYPPFSKLIKLVREDRNLSLIKNEEQKILEVLQLYKPASFPAFHEKLKNKYRWNILLKLPPHKWPDETLRNILANIHPAWQIVVDPDSII